MSNKSADRAAQAGDQLEDLSGYAKDLSEFVREAPLVSLAIAAAAGFLVGGGARSRIGLAMLGIVGRVAIENIASSFVAAAASGSPPNEKPRSASPDRTGSAG